MRPDTDLPERLRIDPAKLDKMTVPQIVERVSQINAWRAENMAEANAARAMNPATQVVKEYPDQGYKWVELRQPEQIEELPRDVLVDAMQKRGMRLSEIINVLDDPQRRMDLSRELSTETGPLADALKYEGETMGHCVGGYCPDVAQGKSRIYSLRDSKGAPHVTIEVKPGFEIDRSPDDLAQWLDTPEGAKILKDHPEALEDFMIGSDEKLRQVAPELFNKPPEIVQIKGKANAKPKDAYIPFVQDFVKGGQWSKVGDLGNTGLIDVSKLRSGSSPGVSNDDFKRLLDAGLRERGEALEGMLYGTVDDIIKTLRPEAGFYRGGAVSGHAAGGLVSAYNPEAVDAMVNQILEGEYV